MPRKWEAKNFCKCICFGNYTILDLPDQTCLSCTKAWCLQQNLAVCAGARPVDEIGIDPDTSTGKEGDVESRCFQRDSPRDQLIVTVFILVVCGLLLGAGIRNRMIKAGLDPSVPWTSGRKWWEAWKPRRQPAMFGNRSHSERREYVPLHEPLSP